MVHTGKELVIYHQFGMREVPDLIIICPGRSAAHLSRNGKG